MEHHVIQIVRDFLNKMYPNRGGPITWPGRIPDLNPFDLNEN